VYWLQRPPYLRWAAALALVLGAAAWDLRPAVTDLHPFLTAPVRAGEPIVDWEWRAVPSGVLPDPISPSGAAAAVDLPADTPLIEPTLRSPIAAPPGWWEVPVAVGAHASAGDEVLLVVVDPPTTVAGIVVTAQQGDPYSLDYVPAAVAVPAEFAPLVAAASAGGTLVAAVRPASARPVER
jgi:hypothetical protein